MKWASLWMKQILKKPLSSFSLIQPLSFLLSKVCSPHYSLIRNYNNKILKNDKH